MISQNISNNNYVLYKYTYVRTNLQIVSKINFTVTINIARYVAVTIMSTSPINFDYY